MDTFKRLEMLRKFDNELADLLEDEEYKQRKTIGLIASENIASPLSTCLEGSIFTNKNTEGYPGKRYVSGTTNEDKIELLAIERLKKLFGCEHANLQSGNASIANSSVLMGLLKPGEKILSMSLSAGGHLSHGAKFNFSGKFYNVVQYGVSEETEQIDISEVRKIAIEEKPKIIICGGSAYPRLIDYAAFRKIADEVGAYLWVDAAHIIGLIAGGAIPSPVPYADVVTFSTQKTLRGPRGCGVILCKEELKNKIDRGVFPGMQGGPKADMIAARAVLFKECMTKEYSLYQHQVVKNAAALAEGCKNEGLRLVTDGTDTHLVLVKIPENIESGKEAELLLESVGIITNKNLLPFDRLSPELTSGIRIGSPLMTTRGAKEGEMNRIGHLIGITLKNKSDKKVLDKVKQEVDKITDKYEMFAKEWNPTDRGTIKN
ncbi:serine hydroxymethyltransferase [Anaerocolumna sp. MB42-C2]|uniref:serine hydroxymethyltransferase n=1 Tax=Anaerocolumna sp. MB42-C2 TaxID=3070997 RepID=UPI0027DF2528|nr:serine hydroxymethyltransferase [Anaerocolumna sp. MB42-C2]WMJ90217.1 serine hydroxymethyltransferase [Anaerocolumna sp. MB42-C2]